MWSSKKILIITTPIAGITIMASMLNSTYIALSIPILTHIALAISGYIAIRIRGCPKDTLITIKNSAYRDKSVEVKGRVIYTSSKLSSTVYIVRGTTPNKLFFLYPVLLCFFTYFKPIRLDRGSYIAIGAIPGFIYIFKSKIGGTIDENDLKEVMIVEETICGEKQDL
jgi:hypothetical protein